MRMPYISRVERNMSSMRQLLLVVLLSLAAAPGLFAKNRAKTKPDALNTTLNCRIFGYYGDIYMDSPQDPDIRGVFHANPGEDHILQFQTDRIVTVSVNGTGLFLEPGDSLCAVIRYDANARRPASLEFSGSPRAVRHNEIYQSLEKFRQSMRYKGQLLACAVVDVKPAVRIADSEKLLAHVRESLDRAGDRISADFRTYVDTYYESMACLSKFEYPTMYAELRKLPVEQQQIGDYWKMDADFRIRDDAVALSCPSYRELLLAYCDYSEARAARQRGETYRRPTALEDIYAHLASFYTGNVRDAVLFCVLANYIYQGKEVERADPLIADYKEKYNVNKDYRNLIDRMME